MNISDLNLSSARFFAKPTESDEISFFSLEVTDNDKRMALRFGTPDQQEEIAVFNLETKEMTLPIAWSIEFAIKLSYGNWRSPISPCVMCFLTKAYEEAKNQTVAKHILEMLKPLGEVTPVYAIYNLIRYYNYMEQIEAIGDSLFCAINTVDFALNTSRKERHKIIELPKAVLTWIETEDDISDKANVINDLRKLMGKDPNEIIEVVEYLKTMRAIYNKLFPSAQKMWFGNNQSMFLSELQEVREFLPEARLKKIIQYAVGQRFKNSSVILLDRYARRSCTSLLDFPINELQTMRDYLETCPDDAFPQNIYKAHNVAMIEAECAEFTDEEKEIFANYGKNLAGTHNDKDAKFEFRVPVNYDTFLKEVKPFQNCLPICGKSFMYGQCDIVLVYEHGNELPSYALETDCNGIVLQAKGYHDLDIDNEDIFESVTKYEKRLIERLERKQ